MSARPPRRGIKISDDPFQVSPTPETEPAAAEAPVLTPVPHPPAAPAKQQILRPGEATFGEKTIKMTWNMPISLNQRLAGAVAFVQMNETQESFDSSTDIVRYGIDFVVKRLEDEFNDGKPFPAPRALRRGRGAKA